MIVVTGGSKGIGRAIIEKFAQKGYHVCTCGRDKQALDQLKMEIETKYQVSLHYRLADLSKPKDIEDFIWFVHFLDQPIEVLVNNAGYFVAGSITEEPAGTLENMLNTNLLSAYHVTRGLVGKMKAQKKGDIFNICSIASITAYPNGGSYCISKFALYGMTKVLRLELMPHQIRVVAVLPGATLTDSWAGAGLPPERFIKPQDVAKAIYAAHALSSQAVIEEMIIRPQLGDI
ncbi:SDR family oxidoreductase [Hugenholtzia roseola]|uniref:SDR family oxidoreductase n=1 Tax=Hugenholtzia roseola TaxID=1002 RepID=UPI00047AC768|nr:SDR family oxidoreductase [Hugenholtzia roseola]